MQRMQRWIRLKGSKQFLQPNWNKTSLVGWCLGETCSGTLRKRWGAHSSWLFRGGIVREGLVQKLLRINSLIQCQWLASAERTWVVKWNFDQVWENPSSCGSIFPAGRWERDALGVLGVFPAAGPGSCAVSVAQAVTVGFSQHIQNFSQLRALGMIYFTPACKDFTWAFPFHHFQPWFGVWFVFCFSFYSFLCRGKFPIGYRGCETLLGWEVLLSTGTWRGLALPSPPRAGLGKGIVSIPTSLFVGQTGQTGTEGWFGARPTAGAAPGFPGSWICVWAVPELSLSPGSRWAQLSVVPSGCTLTGYNLSCSADVKYQEVKITRNFQF